MATFSSAAEAFSSFTQGPFDLQAMLKTSGITYDVQRHLVRVYATLTAAILCAACGCGLVLLLSPTPFYSSEHGGWLGLLTFLGATGGSIWLHMEPVHHTQRRFGLLMAIAASMGVSLASLVEVALAIDPTILITAFMMTTTVFLCFTGSAVLATRRSYLYLGGLLGSALSIMAIVNLLNIFARSYLIYTANLYVGLAMFCGYVVFDTQMIIEKASLGDKDSIKHALELFLDFISIFVRIMIILTQNAEKKKREEDNKRRRR